VEQQMVNYYEELGISSNSSVEEIVDTIKKAKRQWNSRQNAPDLSKRQLAEQKVAILDEAAKILGDKIEKKKYDALLTKELKKDKSKNKSNEQSMPFSTQTDERSPLLIQARTFYNQGFLEQTINLCNRAILEGSTDAEIYLLLGETFIESDNLRGALATYQTATGLFPSDIRFLDSLAGLYLYSNGNFTEANRYVKRVLEINPNMPSALGKQLLIDLFTGQEVKANHQMEQYLLENQYDDNYRYHASRAYINYANSFIRTSDTGADYFADQESYDKYVQYYERAYDIYKENSAKDSINKAKKYGILKKDWPSVIIGGLFGAYLVAMFAAIFVNIKFIGPVVRIAALAGIIVLFVKILKKETKPLWKMEYEKLTKDRNILDKVCHKIWDWYRAYLGFIFSPAGIALAFSIAFAAIGFGGKGDD
jgi:curved DNA-binding protein CbpA